MTHYLGKATTLVLALFVLLLSACSSVPEHSPQNLIGSKMHGKASYYAMKYQFRTTASGETFNNYAATAAHKTLPFGTMVRVTNRANNKSVVVKINDRGPFIKGRIIDLSRSSFAKIADLKVGVIDVTVEVIKH